MNYFFTNLFFLLFFLFGLTTNSYSQYPSLEWVKQMGDTGGTNTEGQAIVQDDQKNVYTYGYFRGTVDFNPNSGVDTFTLSGNGFFNLFLQKLDSNGTYLWTKTFEGAVAGDININNAGDIFLTGSFRNTADLEPGLGVTNFVSTGGHDIFILSLDSNGNLNWGKTFGGPNSENNFSIEFDSDDNIVMTGGFRDTVDVDPGAGIFLLNNRHPFHSKIYVLKLDMNGDFLWAVGLDGNHPNLGVPNLNSYGRSIAIDPNDNIYIAGNFADTVDFDAGNGSFILIADGEGKNSAFVLKLDKNGNFSWVKSMGGSKQDEAYDIVVNSLNNLYVVGYYQDTCILNPGNQILGLPFAPTQNGFLLEIDTTGNILSTIAVEAPLGASATNNGIELDPAGNVYMIGSGSGSIDFNPSSTANHFLTANVGNGGDGYIYKLDASLNLLWARIIGSNSIEYLRDIDCNSNNNFVVTGSFQSTVDFNPDSSTTNLTSMGVGYYDAFVLKIGNNSIYSSINQFIKTDNNLLVFPNPSSEFITVHIDGTISQIHLYKLNGQKVASFSESTFSIKDLNTGSYLIQVVTEEGSYSRLIVKQ